LLIGRFANEKIAVRPATAYRISFTLLNANPFLLIPTWEIANALEKYVKVFTESLKSLAVFSIDSQILHFASLSKKPRYDREIEAYVIRSSSLMQFFNPSEWKLDFTDNSTEPLLNFILFVPSLNESPLQIQASDGSYSKWNAFISPQWGGIVIYNPPSSLTEESDSLKEEDILGRKPLSLNLNATHLKVPMQMFVTQMRLLLGLAAIEDFSEEHGSSSVLESGSIRLVPSSENAIAFWERDFLLRRFLLHNMNATIATLYSLSNLVQNLSNIVVPDRIAELCSRSLCALTKAHKLSIAGQYDLAHEDSKLSMELSEEAFFDANMLGLLYFPDEHKYAIYALPFAPIFVQMFTGIWQEYKSRQQKQRKLKNE